MGKKGRVGEAVEIWGTEKEYVGRVGSTWCGRKDGSEGIVPRGGVGGRFVER